jgi:hypothetical protein
MSINIQRSPVAVTVVRPQSTQLRLARGSNIKVVRSPGGPQGEPSDTDMGWTLTLSLGSGEFLPLPAVKHRLIIGEITATSFSGFGLPQVLLFQQFRFVDPDWTVINSVNVNVGPGPGLWTTVCDPPLILPVDDVPTLTLPDPADDQASDLAVILGSAA